MRRLLLNFICLVSACGSSHSALPTAPDDSSTLRALTWNVQQSSGSRVDSQCELIASTQPDVVVLQEAYRGEMEHFRQGLSGPTGHSWDARYAPAVRRTDGNEGAGVIVLSRLPIVSSDVTQMNYPDRFTTSRPALRVRVQRQSGRPLDVITTHLTNGADGADARNRQARHVLDWAASSGAEVILGGDFNAEPQAPELSPLTSALIDAWAALGRGGGETFSSDRPTRRIDYWFVPRGAIAPVDAAVIDVCRGSGGCLSDHKALLTTFGIGR